MTSSSAAPPPPHPPPLVKQRSQPLPGETIFSPSSSPRSLEHQRLLPSVRVIPDASCTSPGAPSAGGAHPPVPNMRLLCPPEATGGGGGGGGGGGRLVKSRSTDSSLGPPYSPYSLSGKQHISIRQATCQSMWGLGSEVDHEPLSTFDDLIDQVHNDVNLELSRSAPAPDLLPGHPLSHAAVNIHSRRRRRPSSVPSHPAPRPRPSCSLRPHPAELQGRNVTDILMQGVFKREGPASL